MNPNIYVLTDHIPELPKRVYWNYDCNDNHKGWICVREITVWLESHNIDYEVTSFQINQAAMDIPSEEARTMIKLTWPTWVAETVDRQWPLL